MDMGPWVVDIGEGPADSAVAAGTRQYVDVQPEENRKTALVAHWNGEALVVDQRRSVGHGPPAEDARRWQRSVGERIGQLEDERLAIRIGNRKFILEELAVVGAGLHHGRMTVVINGMSGTQCLERAQNLSSRTITWKNGNTNGTNQTQIKLK